MCPLHALYLSLTGPGKAKGYFLCTFFYCCSNTVDSVFLPSVPQSQLSSLTPLIPPTLIPPHLVLSMCLLYMFHRSLAPFPPLIPTDLPCGCCQFLLYFTVSGYIWPASLFCSLGSPYRGDHIVFVFHRLPCFT